MKASQLLPCPFCGDRLTRTFGGFWLHSNRRPCPIGEFEFAPEDMRHWNNRSQQSSHPSPLGVMLNQSQVFEAGLRKDLGGPDGQPATREPSPTSGLGPSGECQAHGEQA